MELGSNIRCNTMWSLHELIAQHFLTGSGPHTWNNNNSWWHIKDTCTTVCGHCM